MGRSGPQRGGQWQIANGSNFQNSPLKFSQRKGSYSIFPMLSQSLESFKKHIIFIKMMQIKSDSIIFQSIPVFPGVINSSYSHRTKNISQRAYGGMRYTNLHRPDLMSIASNDIMFVHWCNSSNQLWDSSATKTPG